MPKSKMNRANIFMGASWAGLAGMLIFTSALWVFPSDELRMVGAMPLLFGSLALLWTRKADEYTEGLWNAGASVAFGALLLSTFGLGFAQGFIDGLLDRDSDDAISADAVLTLQIAAFYIGLFIKRLLGDR
jgi:hypothetical protein